MNPLLASDSYSRGYAEMVYSAPLLRMNPETTAWDAKEGAAESFTLSPDGLRLTYRLKPGLVWSDGRPITSADYLFTFEKMRDPAVDYPYRANLTSIASARALIQAVARRGIPPNASGRRHGCVRIATLNRHFPLSS